ncbi:MAG: hypothetical protein KKD44_28120 [Proteobacteria bacterium]|nr:hypothetical protein [Pseudomonadota bacterium]
MSFGTFSAKYSSEEPTFPLDLSIEADHPFTFNEGFSNEEFMTISGQEVPSTPSVEANPDVIQALQMPNLQDLPWSMIIPAAFIGVAAIGVAWYLNGKKLPEIPM